MTSDIEAAFPVQPLTTRSAGDRRMK